MKTKKYKLVKQDNLKDCGVASLETIIEYYGGYVPLEILREKTKTNRDGTNAYNIIMVAKELGFESYGIKCELESIEKTKITLPAIAYTIINNSYKHFLVIYEINYQKNYVVIADPATKVKKMSFVEFKKIFQNVLIILYPKKEIKKYSKQNMFLKDIFDILRKRRFEIIKFLILVILFTFLNIINLFFIQNIIHYKFNFMFFWIIIILIKETINFCKNKLIIIFSNNVNFDLTKQVFFRILRLPYQYYRNRTTGEVMTRIQDVNKLENSLCNIMISFFVDGILIISTSFFLIYLSSTLFLTTLSLVLLYIINHYVFQKLIKEKYKDVLVKTDETNNYFYETINSFETIKGLNIEDTFMNKFTKKYNDYNYSLKNYQFTCNKEASIKNLISSISILVILYIGMLLVNNNILTIEELFTYYTLSSFFIDPIKDIFDNSTSIKEVTLLVKRINDLYYLDNMSYENHKINNIVVDNLTYRLNNKTLLNNINFHIQKNSKIALIGKSGSGKSTLLKLIKKYYFSKKVLINGSEKGNTNILYVSQNENLFTDTLYNNIVLDRNIKKTDLKKVLKICDINGIIHDNYLNYNMLIEENGFNISGGEKQRIVLARSLLQKADVLLLDEVLSEVDISLERKIIKNILKSFKNKTIIYVTHRLDNIDLFSKVIKLENKNLEVLERRMSYV